MAGGGAIMWSNVTRNTSSQKEVARLSSIHAHYGNAQQEKDIKLAGFVLVYSLVIFVSGQ